MRRMNFARIFFVLVLCVVGLGFYRGWFALSSQSGGSGENTIDVNLTLDPDKAKADAHAVEDKARDLSGHPAEGAPVSSP